MNGLFARLLPYLLAFFGSGCIMVLELVASRLVARHVGSSLSVWTSVIGVILAGICLGNVLGGKLADACRPRKAIGPLYALGALMTLSTLWVNASIPRITGLEQLAWEWRALAVVLLEFLLPSTVLGMIGPVTAKMAVEGARRAGSAMGRVYALGNLGSIGGTLLAGYLLMYYAQVSTIVTIVAAALLLPAAFLMGGVGSTLLGLAATGLLAAGASVSLMELNGQPTRIMNIQAGDLRLNALALAGHAAAGVVGLLALVKLVMARVPRAERADFELSPNLGVAKEPPVVMGERVRLGDLAALSFVASIAFMAFEMTAGRLVTRHLGSSIFGWTSVISVMLAGLAIGNYLGGKIGDRLTRGRGASWLLLLASIATLSVILAEAPPRQLAALFDKDYLDAKATPTITSALRYAIRMDTYPFTEVEAKWGGRVLLVVSAIFFLPSLILGTISPVCAKLAIDRFRGLGRSGAAIGNVYAWGMVGSLLGTFLTGFYLIDWLGTRGVLLAISAVLAIWATVMGGTLHAIWAGIPIGLAIIAFVPYDFFRRQATVWGIIDPTGDPNTEKYGDLAHVDESAYYYIKVTNENRTLPAPGATGDEATDPPDEVARFRTLVLDNLIHGYYLLGHPEHLEYDYEFIYALVAHRAAQAKARATQGIDEPLATLTAPAADDAAKARRAEALSTVDKALDETDLKALFLGGGAYTFPRYMRHNYLKIACDIAEIDPAVLKANRRALGFADQEGGPDAEIRTTLGDARQFVVKAQQRGERYDVIFGDAFNDFSVPWHLTTREFNKMLADILTDDGVYMINIIDKYHSDSIGLREVFSKKYQAEAVAWAEGREAAERWPASADAYASYAVKRLLVHLEGRIEDRRTEAGEPVREVTLDELVDELEAVAKGGSAPDQEAPATAPKRELLDKVRDDAESKETYKFTQTRDDDDDRPREPDQEEITAVGKVAVAAAEDLFGKVALIRSGLEEFKRESLKEVRRPGGFLASWIETANHPDIFPYITVYGTHAKPGTGLRETFVVVGSKKPIDLDDLGDRPGDPQFEQNEAPYRPKSYTAEDLADLKIRARGIILTDDYAPVENLLAPTAETRAERD